MSKKGKEPPGLRRWRLAHRAKKPRRHTMAKRKKSRGRYGRKRKGRRGDRRFPVLLALPVISPTISAATGLAQGKGVKAAGLEFIHEVSGVDAETGQIHWPTVSHQITLAVIGLVGHKMANRMGINRTIKKIPVIGSYFKL